MQQQIRWGFLSLFVFFLLGFNRVALADDAALMKMVQQLQEEMKSMRQTVELQNEKIAHLENKTPAENLQAPSGEGTTTSMSDDEFSKRLESATGGASKWLKGMKQGGDLRLRYEALHYASGNPSETDDRNRFRYRLRYGVEKKFSDEMKVGFGLSSGESSTTAGNSGRNADPTSTNTTFDNNFSFKDIFIEKAHATYQPSILSRRGILDKTEIGAGKVVNPFEKGSSELVWDRDVRPEGVYEKADFKFLDAAMFSLGGFVTAGQFVLDEDATVGGDANLFAYQIGLNPVMETPLFDRPVEGLMAVSLYDYSNYARQGNFLIDGVTSLAKGNTNQDGVATELDSGKFKVIDFYNELSIYPMGMPTRLSFDVASNPSEAANTGVLHDNLAYAFGIKLGGIAKKGDWETLWQYRYMGANSVVGAFSDSDFGDGGVSRRGNVFKVGYALTDSITFNSAAFFVENLNAETHTAAGYFDQQQRRFQFDLSWKF